MRVAFPVFPGAEELDLAGLWEALALARDSPGHVTATSPNTPAFASSRTRSGV